MSALTVLLVLFVVVALLDRATFMPDEIRKVLSLAGYIGALVAAWMIALRYIREARGLMGAAKLLETAEPSLREKLLSAVELGRVVDGKALPDSPEFRAFLQDDVASHFAGFDAKKILPTSLLRPWIFKLVMVATLVIALSFIPSLHLPGFMARAALPFANLARPSSVKISIITPAKADSLVPFASSVPLAVQVDGSVPKHVYVEFKADGGKVLRTELSSTGGKTYEGSVGIQQSSVKYRVLAADGVTAWHTLDARPRPRVVEFQKTIVPPAYAGLPETKLNEDHGDISALEGSTVKLTLKTNQAIEQSVATVMPTQAVVAMKKIAPNQLAILLPVDGKADSWQLGLTSAETKFTNEESTPWHIETVSDLPPTVAITEPVEQVEVRSDDVIKISGEAADDIGLAKIELSYAINAADWKNSEIAGKSGKEAKVTTDFKLAPMPVKAGDAVLIKLVATDLKGQRAESQPVRLVIVEAKLDLTQRAWAAKQRLLAKQAASLEEKTRELRKEVDKAKTLEVRARKGEMTAEAEAERARAKQALANVQESAEDLWKQLKDAAKEAPDRLKALEVNLVAQRLASLRAEHLKQLAEQFHAEQMDTKLVKVAANEAAGKVDSVAQALKAFAAEHTAEALKENMEHLAPQQNHLADKAIDANRDNATRPKWQEQQRAALAQAQHAKEDFEAFKEVAPNGRERDASFHVENLEKKMAAVQAGMDSEKQHQAPEFVYSQAHEMRNATNQARDAARWFADESAQKAREQREHLMQQENPALATLALARDRATEASVQKHDKTNAEPKHEQAEDKLAAAARQFKDQSELREQNPLTNTQAALDMNRLGRALDNLAQQAKHDPSPENMKKVAQQTQLLAKAARALEADAQAQDAKAALQDAQQSAMAQTDPKDQLPAAQAAASQLKELPQQLRRAEGDQAVNDAQNAANNAQWQRDELQNQQREIAQQKQNGQQPQPKMPQQNKALEANANANKALNAAMEKFAPKVADARDKLAEMTPKLSELAKNTANELKDSQKQTAQAADAAKQNQAAEKTAEQANALVPKAKENAEQLADLQAALRQEADKANLNEEGQRQMARTADGALAQMRQQTPQIKNNIVQAAKSQQAPKQAKSLQKAAQSQQQTAQALDQLAQNLAKMEKGEMLAEDAVAAQQQMEETLGVKQPLDESYQKAEQLAQLMQEAKDDPQKALNALEQELKKNPAMQRALGNLAEQTAQQANQQVAQAQTQPAMAPQAAEAAAHDTARVARHEQRLDQKQAAQQVAEASKQLDQVAQAAQKDPAQNTPQNAQQAAQAAQTAQQAASDAAKQQNESTPPPTSVLAQAQGAMLAQALDQLDQAVHPATGQSEQEQQQGQPQDGQQQQGPQKGQQANQQNAQQQLAQANQAQAQSMAQQRAQGQTPGQQQPGNKPGKGKAEGQPSEQPSEENGSDKETAPNVLVPALAGTQTGDWGHLPSRMAKDLTEASRHELSPEYRAAIESYYKAIAEKAKK